MQKATQTVEREPENDLDWIGYELGAIALGDERLNWRLLDTAAKLAARPQGSINQASDDWADTKATYRLFANRKTSAAQILLPHQQRTKERLAGQTTVLAIQDTSFLDYSHHPKKQGMGPIGTSKQPSLRGLVMHTCLLTSTTGVPLGIASQRLWARAEASEPPSDGQRRNVPIEAKESNKWLVALSDTQPLIPAGTRLVTVGDREADIFELFDHARSLHSDFLIRATQDRCVSDPEIGHLYALLSSRAVAGQLKVQVPARNQQPERQAIVSVRYARVTLKAPAHLAKKLVSIDLSAVWVCEEAPPPGVEPLTWLLLTTVPVLGLADAIQRIQWYRQRWQIEIYHKVLKSGCRIEQSQLATIERLLPFLALFSLIAWRLFWLTYIARHDPDAPCTTSLANHEWQALYAYHHKTNRTPAHTPTVRQAILWLAQLGGFLARRHDGPPGVTVIWRGWQRLADISSAWLIFHPT
jgi:hypothetical protein